MPHYRSLGEKCYSRRAARKTRRIGRSGKTIQPSPSPGRRSLYAHDPGKAQEIAESFVRDQAHVFGIVDLATDTLIGRCALFDINYVDCNAMLGMVIGEKEYWGRVRPGGRQTVGRLRL